MAGSKGVSRVYIFHATKGKKNSDDNFISVVLTAKADGSEYVLHRTSIKVRGNNQFFDIIEGFKFAVDSLFRLDQEYNLSDVEEAVFCTEVQALYNWQQKGHAKEPYNVEFDKAYKRLMELPFKRIGLLYTHINPAKTYCKESFVNMEPEESFEDMQPAVMYLNRGNMSI